MDTDSQEAGSSPAPSFPDGSRVLGMDGLPIGEVVASYREHLIVERGYFFPTNYFIPFSAVAEAGGGDVVLTMSRMEALTQGWDRPPADPVAPPASVLPAPPPDPTFPGSASSEPARRQPVASVAPAPLGQPSQPEAPVAAAGPIPASERAGPTPSPEAIVASDPEPSALDVVDLSTASAPRSPEPSADSEVVVAAVETLVATGTTSLEPGGSRVTVDPPEPPPASVAPAAAGPPGPASTEHVIDPVTGNVNADAPALADPVPVAAGYPPPMVGIPGRRLSDTELWSLLEPKEGSLPDPPSDPVTDVDGEAAEVQRDVPDAPKRLEP